MKKFIAVLVAFTLSLSTCVFAACGTDEPSGEVNPPSTEQPEPNPDAAKYSAQIEKAGEVYGNFVSASKINGGLFVNRPSGATAVKSRAADGKETAVTVEAIREIIKKYDSGTSAVFTNIFNSYVCDIFSYMQAQTAIIEEYGVNSLINEYKLTYDGLDLSDANISDGQKEWLPQVLPIAASFPGADLETGRVYCELTHLAEQTREKVCTSLEYYYASAGDMGVTTVNRHYGDDGEPYSFEYHYCDLANGTILFGEGDFEGEEITVNNIWTITFRTWNMNSSIYSEDDKAAMIAFIRSEAERIYGQIDDIKVQNDAIKSDLDIDKDEIVKACNVAVDVSVLNAMLIK